MANETLVTIVGNLTDAPELRYTQSGLAVANFTIASSPRNWDRQQEKMVDGDPLYLRCSAWRELGEHASQSLAKGSRVIAQGRLKQRTFEAQGGEKRTVIELEVDELGPSLRYATAVVTRAQGGGFPAAGAPAAEPWATTAPATPASASGDVWGAPGADYNDSTPF